MNMPDEAEKRREEKIARKEAKRAARKAAKKAKKSSDGTASLADQRKTEFDERQREKNEAYNKWRTEKSERNEASGGYNGSRKSDRNISNTKNGALSAKDEMDSRLDAAIEFIKVNKKHFEDLIGDFNLIGDPRHQSYIDYNVPELLFFGILTFLFHAQSRRESNTMVTSVFLENILEWLPQIEKLPHADTLCDFLKVIDVDEIEEAKLRLIWRLIRSKKLDAFRVDKALVFCIDGVHKFTRDYEWCPNALEHHVSGKPPEEKRYLAYAVELSILLPEGHTLPVMTEFIDRATYGNCGTDTAKAKQDCETNAAKRLIRRLRDRFPNLKMALAADGLYATGPMLQLCLEKDIDPMFVLQAKSLPSVWEEINAHVAAGMCRELPLRGRNDVWQKFRFVNDIEYEYGEEKRRITIHVAICEENRRMFDKKAGAEKTTDSVWAWISLRQFTEKNVEARCNLIGRPRWNIEAQNMIEKRNGYAYSHSFSEDWDAMRGYHFLMQIAYILNTLTLLSSKFAHIVKRKGCKRTIRFIYEIFNGSILDLALMRERIPDRYQFRWAI